MKNGTTTSSRNAAISPYSSDIARILLGNIHGRADAPHPALAGCAHAVSGHVAAVHIGSFLRRGNPDPRMSLVGLGCAKTPAPAAHVETSRRNCAAWSRIVLRARCSIPCWRIVFSTFRNCMSFHTGWVIRAGSTHSRRVRHVRFRSESDRRRSKCDPSLRAKRRHSHCSRFPYSITSSASASIVGGISRPSAFAVLRLMTRSNLVGCSTGRSAGLAPRKILST